MSKQLKPIPKFANEAEEQAFWEKHDSTDYVSPPTRLVTGRSTAISSITCMPG